MARRLFIVEDAFLIEGRGLVLVPGIVPEGDEKFRAGDSIELRRPDGSALVRRIHSLELLSPPPPDHAVVVVLKGAGKQEIPAGTEVWSIDAKTRRSL